MRRNNFETREIDRKLLELLKWGGVLAPKYVDISRKLGLPVSTVRDRVRKLEKRGIVRDYTTEINGTKIGQAIRVIRLVRFKAAFDKVLERYRAWGKAYPHWVKNIAWMAFTSGHYNMVVVYDFADLEEYNRFSREMSAFMGDLKDVEDLIVTLTVATEGKPERTPRGFEGAIKQLLVKKPAGRKSAKSG